MAKCLLSDYVCEINFTKSVLKHILGKDLYIADLGDLDGDLSKQLLWILKNKVDENLGCYFTTTSIIFGKIYEYELIPNGKNILVNESNKNQYVKLMVNYKLSVEI